MWFSVFFVLGVLWVFYYLWTTRYNYWKSRGFPFFESTFPFGNVKGIALLTEYQGTVLQSLYNRAAPHPYIGYFTWRVPNLLIRDPEILKNVMVKDFAYFRDRLRVTRDEPLTEHLFNLTGDKWKPIRVALTPTFSSGKLKTMFTLFLECAKNLDEFLRDKAVNQEVVDIKYIMYMFTSEIISSCAFGLDLNMFSNEPNEFRTLGKSLVPPKVPLKVKIKTSINAILPQLESFFRFRTFPVSATRFVLGTIKDTVEYREKNNVKRNDFLNLLIEMKNKSIKPDKREETGDTAESTEQPVEMTINLLAAQCFIFLLAGFETSSSVQSYCMYELALNPEIQEKLQLEIDEVMEKHGSLTYQAIQDMEYLDQVISETIRKYPTLPTLTRICTKDYKMPDSDLVVEEGTKLIIPVYALHHDPKYFPDPEKFDPDRFSPERKKEIRPFTYLPFGEGPRVCIGKRFGQLQTKAGLCTVFKNYKLSISKETPIPLKFSCSPVVTGTEGSIMLKIEPRSLKKI